jgi:hypothetical protein
MDVTLTFDGELYLWKDDGSWVFVDLPLDVAEEIHDMPLPKKGFGSVKVDVTLGSSTWSTSVFPDAASGSFVLPVKKAVRTKEGVDVGDRAQFELSIRLG